MERRSPKPLPPLPPSSTAGTAASPPSPLINHDSILHHYYSTSTAEQASPVHSSHSSSSASSTSSPQSFHFSEQDAVSSSSDASPVHTSESTTTTRSNSLASSTSPPTMYSSTTTSVEESTTERERISSSFSTSTLRAALVDDDDDQQQRQQPGGTLPGFSYQPVTPTSPTYALSGQSIAATLANQLYHPPSSSSTTTTTVGEDEKTPVPRSIITPGVSPSYTSTPSPDSTTTSLESTPAASTSTPRQPLVESTTTPRDGVPALGQSDISSRVPSSSSTVNTVPRLEPAPTPSSGTSSTSSPSALTTDSTKLTTTAAAAASLEAAATSGAPTARVPQQLSSTTLADKLASNHSGNLLIIDVRSLSSFLGPEGRIRGSINVSFPSLILKRLRKPGGNLANFTLSSFVTTEPGKNILSTLQAQHDQLDVIVLGDRVEPITPKTAMTTMNPGSVLLNVLEKRADVVRFSYLEQSLKEAMQSSRELERWIVEGESDDELPSSPSSATVSSRSSSPAPFGGLAPPSLSSSTTTSTSNRPPLSPLSTSFHLYPEPKTPTVPITPPIPQLSPPETPNSKNRRTPLPKLRRIDTSDNLLGKNQSHAATGGGLSTGLKVDPHSANHPSSATSTTSSTSTSRLRSRSPAPPPLKLSASYPSTHSTSSSGSGMSLQAMCRLQARSPGPTTTRFNSDDMLLPPPSPGLHHHYSTGHAPHSPTGIPAKPDRFIVSTIIPGFLFLGPEPSKTEDLDQLEKLGVKEVLNLALECDDKDGAIAKRFELKKIPMRDFVEETGVQKSIEEACRIISNAQLQSKPVYCHCRAGKSRSATIVLAYLVHRNHWSLNRAYAHVSERRQGISPNIGFVAELMTWEERQRGLKSNGVFGTSEPPTSPSSNSIAPLSPLPSSISSHNATSSAPSASGLSRAQSDQGGASAGPHTRVKTNRNSMFAMRTESSGGNALSRSTGPMDRGDGGGGGGSGLPGERSEKEREVRAEDGTWVPARRDERDVNSNSLRRASRAGLESFGAVRIGD